MKSPAFVNTILSLVPDHVAKIPITVTEMKKDILNENAVSALL